MDEVIEDASKKYQGLVPLVYDIKTMSLDEARSEDMPYAVYLKREADKVIAEKDKEIQRLENLCESYRIDCDNLAIREANACKEIERDNKQIRHQKYKRCLAMAEWCDAEADVSDADGDYEDMRWYQKWHQKWLELAEKFKESGNDR